MSNSYAIAAVTATLHDLLIKVRVPLPGDPPTEPDLADTMISTKPLDTARDPEGKNQLNIFLYQLAPDAQLRNTPAYGTANGETARQPPVALRLYYLITAYGALDDDKLAHRLLGRAMSLLQDHAIFMPADIQAALAGNDLYRQVERVRVTPYAISTEEISKLWTVFQTQYRLSAAYEVSVVLIDSSQTRRTPLPVLKRGALDQGVRVLPSTLPPYPTLGDVALTTRQPGARLASGALPGDIITLSGNSLGTPANGDVVTVYLTNRWLTAAFPIAPLPGGSSTQVTFQLPDNQTALPAGIYSVSVGVTVTGDSQRMSGTLAFPIVPRILAIDPPQPPGPLAPIKVDASGTAQITLSVSPQVWADQPASLLVDDREVIANARTAASATLVFAVTAAQLGTHYLRVRVDGVDSLVIADYTATPLVFDPSLQVTITS